MVAVAYWALSPTRRANKIRLGALIETASYYDNPFEYWAYKNHGHWETNKADPTLKWGQVRAQRKLRRPK